MKVRWGFCRGFTLIEVLVALAVVTISLAATLRAAATGADNSLALRERTLARWVAENELARLRLQPALPPPGTSSGESRQAEQAFVWQAEVIETPNPNFRRILVRVRTPESASFVAEVQGYTLANR